MGDASTLREFYVTRESIDSSGYLLMQVYHVQNRLHSVCINGEELVGHDIIPTSGVGYWHVWMDVFRANVLRSGMNTIQVGRAEGGDNFYLGNIVVHWEELD